MSIRQERMTGAETGGLPEWMWNPELLGRRQSVVLVTGPTAVGKDAVLEMLSLLYGHPPKTVTATTRPRRPKEVSRRDYLFLTQEQFAARIAAGRFLEYTQIGKWLYGTPASLPDKPVTILRVNPTGVRNILEAQLKAQRNSQLAGPADKDDLKKFVVIFLWPDGFFDVTPSHYPYPGRLGWFDYQTAVSTLHHRLIFRGTEAGKELVRRMAQAQEELLDMFVLGRWAFLMGFDLFHVDNLEGEPEIAAKQIDAIIRATETRTDVLKCPPGFGLKPGEAPPVTNIPPDSFRNFGFLAWKQARELGVVPM